MKYLEERRVYRHDERGQVVKERDHLQVTVRCLVAGISLMRTKKVKRSIVPESDYLRRSDRAWMI